MDDIPPAMDPLSTRFIPRLRSLVSRSGLAYATEKIHVYWICYFIRFQKMWDPAEMGDREVDVYLTRLVMKHNVSSATQRSALDTQLSL